VIQMLGLARTKYIRCRELFANYVVRYTGHLQGAAFKRYELILRFLVQSEMSFIVREHELKKLIEERDRHLPAALLSQEK